MLQQSKRILSLLLVIAMLIGIFPISALAAPTAQLSDDYRPVEAIWDEDEGGSADDLPPDTYYEDWSDDFLEEDFQYSEEDSFTREELIDMGVIEVIPYNPRMRAFGTDVGEEYDYIVYIHPDAPLARNVAVNAWDALRTEMGNANTNGTLRIIRLTGNITLGAEATGRVIQLSGGRNVRLESGTNATTPSTTVRNITHNWNGGTSENSQDAARVFHVYGSTLELRYINLNRGAAAAILSWEAALPSKAPEDRVMAAEWQLPGQTAGPL